MATSTFFTITLSISLLLISFNIPTSSSLSDLSEIELESSLPWMEPRRGKSISEHDMNLLEFPLNLEFLQAEFFLWGSLGQGLDHVASDLTMGGPAPVGARKANLDALTSDIITQFAYQEVGHIRALKKHVEGFPRPLLDLSPSCFSNLMDKAFGHSLSPSFNPYANSINFLLASYLLPYVALTGYEGLNPHLQSPISRRLCAGLLGVQSAQDAVIRALLYQHASTKVEPYGVTVAEFTSRISALRNELGGTGNKDEGLIAPSSASSVEGHHYLGNLLAENSNAICYKRAPREILRILYGKGTAAVPGGFFPNGASGHIAKSYLHNSQARDRMSVSEYDMDLLEFPLNLEFLQAEFFLWGLWEKVWIMLHPTLPWVGRLPLARERRALMRSLRISSRSSRIRKALKEHVEGFPRPLMDLSPSCFSNLMDKAFGHSLSPSFNPYANSINFLLASYLLPYVALTGYEGLNPHLHSPVSRRLCGGLLGVQSAQDAVIRALLYEHASTKVEPYGVTVAEFTSRISALRNELGRTGNKDEGIIAPSSATSEEGKHHLGNLLAENSHSICYQRAPREILRILYGKGTAGVAGGFFPNAPRNGKSISEYDMNLLEFPLNLEFLQAEFFLRGSLGQGLDQVASDLAMGGPAPVGARKANLDALTADIITQFAYQEVGHIRALKKQVEGFPRPLMDLSPSCFSNLMDEAFGHSLSPSFNPYANSINFLLASYLLPYVALTGYEGLNPHLQSPISRRLCAGLLGVQSAQDAVIRALLYQHASTKVEPYGVTVAEFTSRISALRNELGRTGNKDEGLIAPSSASSVEGHHHHGNLLAENSNAICYKRAPREILRILYGKGTAAVPGGFFPNGANEQAKEEQEQEAMGASTFFATTLSVSLLLISSSIPTSSAVDLSLIELESSFPFIEPRHGKSISEYDMNLLEFPLNLEFLQAEFFLWGALGQGLDHVASNLTMGGPAPVGARKANLDALTSDIITQFAYQGVGHIRALKEHVEGFPRPLLDLSPSCFSNLMDKAFGHSLSPSFNPYANSVNFLLASYLLPYVALTGYEGLNPHLQSPLSRRLCAGLLGVQSAQDAVIRALLYQHAASKVEPYGVTVAEFTSRISALRNELGGTGNKDEGLIAPSSASSVEGHHHHGNLLAENSNAICYKRAPREILRILYGKGTAAVPGGFFPNGANGQIAKSYLHNSRF
ncbi:Desiccation-related protein PCC13-62 [Cinnamomum micranthum f. kanehirae]|uniref:Desiccation-related protein PCC13-62 n=1 Tax=Cinnamomum micranthum f. kanehirae TaxID=337451 RepID=A0A443PBG7_9MAGN|nr:Desiccation-related protein PCC13-62 [Cinnamomum micranthum f. kanehirae]